MVMSSQQIAGMIQQQNSMFAGMASYSQQITPPMGAAPGMGANPMYAQGPPPSAPPMPVSQAWNPGMLGGAAMPLGPPQAGGAQALGESALGAGFSGLSTGMEGMGALSGLAGLASAGLGMAGITGGLATGVAAFGSLPATAALGVGAHAASNMYTGFQQRQGVNSVLRQRFGNVMGIGQGRGGMGFGASEMGGISSMLREMGTEDLTTNMEELTRVMDKTAGMGLYRGVQSAREFKQKFQSTVDSLKEISNIMHTTLEGAMDYLGQTRGMGFFTGQDISRQLAMTRVTSSVTGMSVDQASQMAQQGSQMARAWGGRGRQGAQAGLVSGGRIAMAQSLGILSGEDVAFATGGLTGAEGAQALSSRMQQTSMRFMQSRPGRAMVAGLWDPESGGISQERLNAAMSGELDIRDLLRRGRGSIRETGGRRSEFFRDEDELRNQVLAQGGEYLPMAIYGTHLANRRGLSIDDPIVHRAMRRRFRMSEGEVSAAAEMMRNMPEIQANMLMKGRSVREQEERAAGKEISGLSGLGRRLGKVWEREVENPFRQFADELTTDVTKGIEGLVDTMEGRISAQMSDASKKLIMERSEFGRAVSGSATRATQFSQGDFQKLMSMDTSAGYSKRERTQKVLGQMLGLRPDTDGLGQRGYENMFDIAGEAYELATWVSPATGLLNPLSAKDFSFGLRSITKDLGIEGLVTELKGGQAGRRRLTRSQRARELGMDLSGAEGDDVSEFLRTAEAQMNRDLGYSREELKSLGTEHADIMYRRLGDTERRENWRKSHQTGFAGVENVLRHASRLGSDEFRAAVAKARTGTKAEQVAFVRALEQEGGIVDELQVTDELTRGLGSDYSDYETNLLEIRSRRQEAYGALEEATRPRSRSRDDSSPSGVGEWVGKAVSAVAGDPAGALIGGLVGTTASAPSVNQATKNLLGLEGGGISPENMQRLLADSDTREDFVALVSGKSRKDKDAALRRLEAAASSGTMSTGAKKAYERVRTIVTSQNAKHKDAQDVLKQISLSLRAEDSAAMMEVLNAQGEDLSSAIEQARSAALGEEGESAMKRLARVARLRSSGDRDDVKESFEEESRLMEDIIGTEASKQLRAALQGVEGADVIVGALTGAEGYVTKFGGRRGSGPAGHRAKISNIMNAMLSTADLSLGDASMREAFGGKSRNQIIRELSRGGERSQQAIEKILGVAKDSGLSGAAYEQFEQRMEETGDVLKDRKISRDEAKERAASLGGRLAGIERSRSSAEKLVTEQETANKHLKTISASLRLMAADRGDIELGVKTRELLERAVRGKKGSDTSE